MDSKAGLGYRICKNFARFISRAMAYLLRRRKNLAAFVVARVTLRVFPESLGALVTFAQVPVLTFVRDCS